MADANKDPSLTVQEQKLKELFCEVYSYEVANTYIMRFKYAKDNKEDPIGILLLGHDDHSSLELTREELVYKYITKHW